MSKKTMYPYDVNEHYAPLTCQWKLYTPKMSMKPMYPYDVHENYVPLRCQWKICTS
jgi:hypothetical protein